MTPCPTGDRCEGAGGGGGVEICRPGGPTGDGGGFGGFDAGGFDAGGFGGFDAGGFGGFDGGK
jgi:hypothetical protein